MTARQWIALSAAAVLLCALHAPAAETVALETLVYKTLENVREAWKPINSATPPVDLAKGPGGQTLLRLSCPFRNHHQWRVGWDLRGRWDLSGCQEIRVRARADGGEQASMAVYLHSGDGWYREHLAAPAQWRTVRLTPKNFSSEGSPGGWDSIDRIRLSVSRGAGEDREVLIASMEAITAEPRVTVYHNDAVKRDADYIARRVRYACNSLDRLGVPYRIAGDEALADGVPARTAVLLLPVNPKVPKAADAAIEEFLAGGGKLIGCDLLTEPVLRRLGVRFKDGEQIDPSLLDSVDFERTGGEAPAVIRLRPHRGRRILPDEGTRIAARWIGEDGNPTNLPAVTHNENGYYVGAPFSNFYPYGDDELLLRLLGRVDPKGMRAAYEHQMQRLGDIAGLETTEQIVQAVGAAQDPKRRQRAEESLSQAEQLAAKAREAAKKSNWPEATALARQAHQAYLMAYACTVPPRRDEIRAVWCHKPGGVPYIGWEAGARLLKKNGFNTLIANMLWGGAAAFDSEVLPMMNVAKERGDQVAECVAAARKYGLKIHIWQCTWALGGRTPAAFREELRQQRRLQMNPQGETLNWLCPSSDENQQMALNALLEVIKKYDIDGVHLDYIRYNPAGCYCPRCRRKFQETYGVKVDNWPEDVVNGPLRESYQQFRRDNITRFVANLNAQARALDDDIQISAAVFWDWPSARERVGQDWVKWIREGYLDFVCPMTYTTEPADFEYRTITTSRYVNGAIPLLPGIGATLGQTPDQTLHQVLITRKHDTGGFTLFEYYPVLAEYFLPVLGAGATSD